MRLFYRQSCQFLTSSVLFGNWFNCCSQETRHLQGWRQNESTAPAWFFSTVNSREVFRCVMVINIITETFILAHFKRNLPQQEHEWRNETRTPSSSMRHQQSRSFHLVATASLNLSAVHWSVRAMREGLRTCRCCYFISPLLR